MPAYNCADIEFLPAQKDDRILQENMAMSASPLRRGNRRDGIRYARHRQSMNLLAVAQCCAGQMRDLREFDGFSADDLMVPPRRFRATTIITE